MKRSAILLASTIAIGCGGAIDERSTPAGPNPDPGSGPAAGSGGTVDLNKALPTGTLTAKVIIRRTGTVLQDVLDDNGTPTGETVPVFTETFKSVANYPITATPPTLGQISLPFGPAEEDYTIEVIAGSTPTNGVLTILGHYKSAAFEFSAAARPAETLELPPVASPDIVCPAAIYFGMGEPHDKFTLVVSPALPFARTFSLSSCTNPGVIPTPPATTGDPCAVGATPTPSGPNVTFAAPATTPTGNQLFFEGTYTLDKSVLLSTETSAVWQLKVPDFCNTVAGGTVGI
jgi:hypothetical protein